MYNENIYPKDKKAKNAINCSVTLHSYTKDEEYLQLLDKYLDYNL